MSADWTQEDTARLEEDLADRHGIETIDGIRALPPDARKVYVTDFDDAKALAFAEHAPEITSIFTDGNNRVTDDGVRDLARLRKLKFLDLEWSAVTDAALPWIAQMAALEHVDLEFTFLTPEAVQALLDSRPGLTVGYIPHPLA